MQLHVVVTDLAGQRARPSGDYTDLEVVDPLNDARTARLKVSLYDPAVALLKPLARGLKIVYGDALIFNGIQVSLSFDYAAGTVEIIAHDPTIKLKQGYHRYGDEVVDKGYPIDGIGMRC
jgi:hypothetical protein